MSFTKIDRQNPSFLQKKTTPPSEGKNGTSSGAGAGRVCVCVCGGWGKCLAEALLLLYLIHSLSGNVISMWKPLRDTLMGKEGMLFMLNSFLQPSLSCQGNREWGVTIKQLLNHIQNYQLRFYSQFHF